MGIGDDRSGSGKAQAVLVSLHVQLNSISVRSGPADRPLIFFLDEDRVSQ